MSDDKKKSAVKNNLNNRTNPMSEFKQMKANDAKKAVSKKTGPTKRIPKDWKSHLIKMNPTTKSRLKKAVQHAQFNDDDKHNLQNLFIENALNEYLTKYEKKHKYKTK